MSVLIKGMEMPKSCCECNFRFLWDGFVDDDTFTCIATDGEFGTARKNERQDFCPLVEIPPHGRLIDADAIQQEMYGKLPEIQKAIDDALKCGEGRKDAITDKYTWLSAKKWIELAPTIIEAEVNGNEIHKTERNENVRERNEL